MPTFGVLSTDPVFMSSGGHVRAKEGKEQATRVMEV